MKKTFIRLLIGISLATFSFVTPPGQLTGRWQKRLPDGAIGIAVFRADSSYRGFINGKQFVSGTYYVRQDTLRVQTGGCGGGYYGTYKLTFVTSDSIRFAVIQDTCRGRRRGSDGLTFGRIKSAKP